MFKNLPRARSAARKFHKLDDVRKRTHPEASASETVTVVIPDPETCLHTEILFEFSVRLHEILWVSKAGVLEEITPTRRQLEVITSSETSDRGITPILWQPDSA